MAALLLNTVFCALNLMCELTYFAKQMKHAINYDLPQHSIHLISIIILYLCTQQLIFFWSTIQDQEHQEIQFSVSKLKQSKSRAVSHLKNCT